MNRQIFLVSRTDRAGDLILTLPLFRELRKNFPDCRIIAHVRKYTAPLLQLCPEADSILVDDDYPEGIFCNSIVDKIKNLKIDHAFIVHPSARAIISAWRAGITNRTGRASNIWQFFLSNRKVQKRSRNEKHEFCYNLDLLSDICPKIDYSPYSLTIPDSKKDSAKEIIESVGMSGTSPIVIHPGHGGSAFNLSAEKYAELAQKLIERQIPVLISLGPGEEHLRSFFPEPARQKIGLITGVPDLAILAGIFSQCNSFAGGSTGPMHIAASLKLPCSVFFPPVKAMTPVRWGPAGCKSLIIKPDLADCDGQCKKCRFVGCMNNLSIDSAVDWLFKEYKNESAN